MDPSLLHKTLKENASGLDQFYEELKNWGENMKNKEEKNYKKSTKINTSTTEKQKKSATSEKEIRIEPNKGVTDYSAWDKFDADAECEKIDYDENDDSELTDEFDETLRDEAYVEKEKGNKFVKTGKWDEAIQCYTKAIDCYSYDPIFYANRALCFLKKEKMIKAEADCTMSLKLDRTYVKAYQRRAAAREALNKIEEAISDLTEVLELEPKNKESREKLDKLRDKINKNKNVTETVRPVSKFTASRNQRKNIHPVQQNTSRMIPERKDEDKGESWPNEVDDVVLVKTISKPAHLLSKKPLKRIEISEVVGFEEVNDKTQSPPSLKMFKTTLKTDDLKIVERTADVKSPTPTLKESKNQANSNKLKDQVELFTPKNSVQFYSHWKYLKTLDEKYSYMKLIEPDNLPNIFKESLDSNVFSEIIEVLANCFMKNNEEVFKFLLFFSKMKRFSTFTMFMSDNDRNNLLKLFEYIKTHEDQTKEEVDKLFQKYEL